MNRYLKYLIIWTLICYSFVGLFHDRMVFAVDPIEITDIIEDGYMRYRLLTDAYTEYNDSTTAYAGVIVTDTTYRYRIYIEFNITGQGIGATDVIDAIYLQYYIDDGYASNVNMYSMESQPSLGDAESVYNDAADGNVYIINTLNRPTGWNIVQLTDAEDDFNVSSGWFAVGVKNDGISDTGQIRTEETSYAPRLIVYYHTLENKAFTFEGPYYENGTRATAFNVTASNGVEESFLVNGTTTQYYDDLGYWAWDLGSTSRFMYYIGIEENFTVTIPEDSYSLYAFTIRDYTLRIGNMEAWLEAHRMINGSLSLIERNRIYDQQNPVPMNLVIGKSYTMKVRFEDGTVVELGYYMASSDTDHTYSISDYAWGDMAQTVYKDITAEATRPNATHIQLAYSENMPLQTTEYANMTIYYRNGTLVTQVGSIGSSTVTLHWYSANNITDYLVQLDAKVSYHGEIHRSWILEYPRTYDSAGGLETDNIIAFIVACIVMGAFTYISRIFAPFIGVTILGVFTAFGLASFTAIHLGVGYSLSFLWAMVVAER